MARLELLSKSQRIKFDSSPVLKKGQIEDYFALSEDLQDYLTGMRKPINKARCCANNMVASSFAS